MTTVETWEMKLAATQTIVSFMGDLEYRYSAEDMNRLWKTMKEECQRYGRVFVAEAIRKDPKDAELALFRFYRKYIAPKEQAEPEEEPGQSGVRVHYRYPKQRDIARRLVAMIIAGIIALVLLTTGLTTMSLKHSDDVIARADRILEVNGR